MTASFELRIDDSEGDGTDVFYWTTDHRCSFIANVGPFLGRLGEVPSVNVDLVRIALAVYAADRTVPRKFAGSDWNQRSITVAVAVSNVSLWQSLERELSMMLDFLSGDAWSFTFTAAIAPIAEPIALHDEPADRVVLLSGGADSALGALLSRQQLPGDGHHTLVSHFSASHIAPIQTDLAQRLLALPGSGTQGHEVFHLARRATKPDGTDFPSEPSSRSRSFLFLSLGLAVAALDRIDLWIPENGFASLNPPLGPDRRGSLSTRTTHPKFIGDFNALLTVAGIESRIHNPFSDAEPDPLSRTPELRR